LDSFLLYSFFAASKLLSLLLLRLVHLDISFFSALSLLLCGGDVLLLILIVILVVL
jgi:hypothetical protein